MQKPPTLLVFEDVDSVEFLRQVRRTRPAVACAFCTGASTRVRTLQALKFNFLASLPLTARQLPRHCLGCPPPLARPSLPQAAGVASAKTFDLSVRMKNGQDYLFRGIPRCARSASGSRGCGSSSSTAGRVLCYDTPRGRRAHD